MTRTAETGNDAARNGEPDGELGLIRQKDHGLWQTQTGGPSDPQPGNIPGGPRDVLRSADFNNGLLSGFAVDSGTFAVTNGTLLSPRRAAVTRLRSSTPTRICRSTTRSPRTSPS